MALAMAAPLPATKSSAARTGQAAPRARTTPARAAAAHLVRRVTVVTCSLFDAAASWASRLRAEKVGRRSAALEDVLHAPLDRRLHVRVGEDVEAILADGVEDVARHLGRRQSGGEEGPEHLATHLGHARVGVLVGELGRAVAVGL